MVIILLPLLISLGSIPILLGLGVRKPQWTGWFSVLAALAAFLSTLYLWLYTGGGILDLPWAPTWGLRLQFAFDGIAALYVTMITGIGLIVLLYSTGYIPRHLDKEKQPTSGNTRFYAEMMLFMAAMVGLALAQDMILMFLFWDTTTLTSYFLIGFDREKPLARHAALMAVIVTGIGSLFFLIGALMLAAEYGTFALPEILAKFQLSYNGIFALGLIIIAAAAKSAQFPFHIWLPRAMRAPTPVSAYLHSSAMVAAGVLLLSRFYPVMQRSPLLLAIITGFGIASMFIASLLAITANDIKRILAYSTIAQYGYMFTLLGMNNQTGAAAASFYFLAHALIKCALFLSAGAVMEATGKRKSTELGGLWGPMPVLGVFTALHAIGLAGLPLTIGYFKDDLFFQTALQQGRTYPVLAVLSATLTIIYMYRYWVNIFLGKLKNKVEHIPPQLGVMVAVLGLIVFLGGIYAAPFAKLSQAAARVMTDRMESIGTTYEVSARTYLALYTYASATILLLFWRWWKAGAQALAGLGKIIGVEKWYFGTLNELADLSGVLYRNQFNNLVNRLTTILVPAALLLAAGFLSLPIENTFKISPIQEYNLPLAFALLVCAAASITIIVSRNILTQIFAISTFSFALVAVFSFFGSPNIGIVAVLTSIASSVLFIAILMQFSSKALGQIQSVPEPGWAQIRNLAIAGFSGLFAFGFVWSVLSLTRVHETVAFRQSQLSLMAYAHNVVAMLLVDMRQLDTMGEISVIGIALIGIATLLVWGKEK